MYGDTVHKYLQSYCMDHAAKLLSDTDKSIADIALDIGYENRGNLLLCLSGFTGCLLLNTGDVKNKLIYPILLRQSL